MMGFDCESFGRLLDKFTPAFNGHTPLMNLDILLSSNIPREGREKLSQKIVWDLY
jgi:hypothetical protein